MCKFTYIILISRVSRSLRGERGGGEKIRGENRGFGAIDGERGDGRYSLRRTRFNKAFYKIIAY